jgi:hypothetical protein
VWVCVRCTSLWDLLKVLAHLCSISVGDPDVNAIRRRCKYLYVAHVSQEYLYVDGVRQVSHDVVASRVGSQRHSRPHMQGSHVPRLQYLRPTIVNYLA